jgi:phosphoribosyl-AMP cyclohydrolase
LKPDFNKSEDGLVPVIVQDFKTDEVLMLAYMNEDAWNEMRSSGYAVYWSRSRKKLWKKGETSGNLQKVYDIYLDCDMDTVLLKVEQIGGAACHTGRRSCFYTRISPDGNVEISDSLIFDPDEVYGKKD